jgi:actin-related protein 3
MLQTQNRSLTGTVVDSGDGVTHVIPVADGYVIGEKLDSFKAYYGQLLSFILTVLTQVLAFGTFRSPAAR